ncbi:carboxypeptidase-like regulatory domain-containing protein [Hymenobacter jeollabukensis]|uniref:Carboxypeptidase-like regulatory domain-containing protein n=1 Tax=Hymenobacter jeollabukensis TaxID=2025313 RepID=A0A5R8WHE8_9BACT|nr:carboxypeptidase-like regulatory domain-containing protein [Hymenobacter jeollabukensis]TLM87330.1 carboxypeptidase-like regulatory domain-containing protein [Hymenobacter jeollabukensis]
MTTTSIHQPATALRRLGSLLLLGLGSAAGLRAQGLVVQGRVVDEKQQPVPFVSVVLPDGSSGTATNEVGEFRLRLAAPAPQLVVFGVGYQRTTAAVPAGGQPLTVTLPASVVALPEVRVSSREQATALVRRAYAKLLRHQADTYYGKGFYRQKTSQAGQYREFFDAFADIRFSPQKIDGWDLGEARFAYTPGGVDFTNFSAITRLLPLFQTAADKPSRLLLPLSPAGLQVCTFSLDAYLTEQERELAVVSFAPPAGTPTAATGKLYIDPATAALHRLELLLPADAMLNTGGAKGPGASQEGAMLHLTTDLVPVADSLTRLASKRAELDMQFLVREAFTEDVHVSSYFLVYQLTPRLKGQSYAAMSQQTNDLQQIRKRRYNPQFWRDNEIIRASPVEERVVRDFEGRRVFGRL